MSKESLQQFAIRKGEELGHNAPDNITNLWHSIVDYADKSNECGAEGNSGEFSDEREQKRLEKELGEVQAKLIANFKDFTGFEPELHFAKFKNGTYETKVALWVLKG